MIAALEFPDWLVIAAYMAFVIGLGVRTLRRQKASDDYLMAGRRLPWWAVGLSLIATSFSTIALLGYTDSAFTTGFRELQLQLGDLLGFALAAIFFLPFFAGRGMTTAYEYLEERFGRTARRVGSLIFIVFTLLRGGALLAATAQAAAVAGDFTSIEVGGLVLSPVMLGILIVGTLAIVYSAMGGLGAVVWTDTLQFLLILLGLGACFFVAVGDLGDGLASVGAEITKERPKPVFIDPDLDPASFPNLLTAILGYGLLAFSVAGTNQQSVQRYMACKDIGAARRAIFLGWGAGFCVVALTMLLGITFAAWDSGKELLEGANVLPKFVRHAALPMGLGGLVMTAILAAMMSSVDSAMHAMSTATLVDFVEPGRRTPLEDRARMRLARLLTVGFGILLLVAAWYAAAQQENVLRLVIRWLGWLLGPLFGLFVLGMGTRRVQESHALIGVALGYLVSVLLNDPLAWFAPATEGTPLGRAGLHGIWTAAIAAGTTVVAGALVSRVWPKNQRGAP